MKKDTERILELSNTTACLGLFRYGWRNSTSGSEKREIVVLEFSCCRMFKGRTYFSQSVNNGSKQRKIYQPLEVCEIPQVADILWDYFNTFELKFCVYEL